MSDTAGQPAPPAWIVATADAPNVAIWGLTPEERLRRSLGSAGCTQFQVLAPDAEFTPPKSGSGLLLRGDAIYDDRLVQALLDRENAVLVAPGSGRGSQGGAVAAHVEAARLPDALALLREPDAPGPREASRDLQLLAPGELAPAYTAALRKSEPPYLYWARRDAVREIEERLFSASYKGITDLITKWVWPRPAAAVTRVLARAGVHPNAVTVASWVLAIAALVLFYRGVFGAGLVAAWVMTFLDTVDGKLARVTLTSSRVGHVLDKSLDLVHPPFWWLAWGLALAPGAQVATAIVVAGYLVGRALEGIFLAAFGMETHSWRPIDSLFRTITARRNPNLILLTVGAMGGRPDLGLLMVAIWTVACIGFHAVRLIQAFLLRARGQAIQAWDEDPAPSPRLSSEEPSRGGSTA
jgi:phosphatidylglycerophosphate synthase